MIYIYISPYNCQIIINELATMDQRVLNVSQNTKSIIKHGIKSKYLSQLFICLK
jgi:hypothetical protein